MADVNCCSSCRGKASLVPINCSSSTNLPTPHVYIGSYPHTHTKKSNVGIPYGCIHSLLHVHVHPSLCASILWWITFSALFLSTTFIRALWLIIHLHCMFLKAQFYFLPCCGQMKVDLGFPALFTNHRIGSVKQ